MPIIKRNNSELKKIAVMDLGTNSVRVLLTTIENGEILYRKKIIETTRLGEGVDKYNVLTERAMHDTLVAVKKFYELSKSEGYTLFKIIGTSALRDANNQVDFLKKIHELTQCHVDVIDGISEAELGYIGVINSFSNHEKNLVIDIGGGSTELIFGNERVDLIESLDIGAVRLTDRCLSEDPPKPEELIFLKMEIDKVIDDFIKRNSQYLFNKVIGIGGTITTLSAINLDMELYNPEKIQGSQFDAKLLDSMIKDFIKKPLNKRKEIKGLDPKRGDIIIAGSLILQRLMHKFNFDKIFVSDYDNLEGIIFKEYLS